MNFCTGCNRIRQAMRTEPEKCGVCSKPFAFVRENGTETPQTAADVDSLDMFAVPAEPAREIVVNRESKNGRVLALLQSVRDHYRPFWVKVDGTVHMVEDGWVPGPYLEDVGGRRYGARLNDLKNAGLLEYESKHLAGSVWIYRATAIRARAA